MGGIRFLLNGQLVHVDQPSPQMTLLDFIRARGLTGAKEGCAEGECGACAVAVVEHDAATGRSALRPVNSCLMFLPMAAGHEIFTVESLSSDDELCEAQLAMALAGGSQCGYCTPGFVVSLFAEQHRPDRRGPCDVMALSGNLCRCTGYRPIADAARSLGPPSPSAITERLQHPGSDVDEAAIPGFSRPATIERCLELLEAHPDAMLVAGATDVCVESNLQGRRWKELISVEAIDELRVFSNTHDRVMIGAALPLNEIARRWTDAPDAFREWMTLFGSPLIRNRATLGGNLATASPIGDAAPLLLALDAVVHIAGRAGRRTVRLASFFKAYRKTALEAGEILTAVEIPKPLPQFVRFYKIAKRRLDDISTVAAAMALDIDGGLIRRARIAFGGVAATPLRVTQAEEAISDQPWNAAAVERVQQILDGVLHPLSDHRGSKEYRLEVSKSLIEKYQWEIQAGA